MLEVFVSNRLRLRAVRAQLHMTQETLSARSGISVPTIINAERGDRIRILSAQAILDAINAERIDRGMGPLGIYDLDWDIGE